MIQLRRNLLASPQKPCSFSTGILELVLKYTQRTECSIVGLMFLPWMQYIFVQTCLFLQFLKLLFCLDTVSQKCRLGNVLAIKVGKCFSHLKLFLEMCLSIFYYILKALVAKGGKEVLLTCKSNSDLLGLYSMLICPWLQNVHQSENSKRVI